MTTDINRLIQLNVELEGLLHILRERESIHAKSLLADKFREYSALLQELINEPDNEHIAQATAAAEELAADATYVEVKDQEAESSEITDETEAATEAIEKEEERSNEEYEPQQPTADIPAAPRTPVNFARLFTLNDKFRFTREVFGGDERAFNDTLAVLSDMPSFEDAADFLYNDMMLDPADSNVAAFMAVISDNLPHNAR